MPTDPTAHARPFDIDDAIRRAARMRALRFAVGLSRADLAAAVGVSEKSVTRWESDDGRGSCPDDVLDRLAAMLDRQRATAAAYADAVAGAPEDQTALDTGHRKPPYFYDVRKPASTYGITRPKLDLNQSGAGGPDSTPGGPRFDAGEADSMPGGGAGGRFDAGAGGRFDAGAGARDADSMPCDDDAIRFDAIAMPCWPSQRAYEELHGADGSFHGVANATLRAIADELDRCGIDVEWRYPTHQNIGMFDIRLIEI